MKTKQGVSLIVLVITIIVMIILAGAIILTLNNSGIIDKASDAVDKTDLATVKELAQMAWAEAYLETDKSQGALEDYVLAKLGEEITDKYIIDVTTKGVSVWEEGTWRMDQDSLTVTNGKVTIGIGDSIAYDETKGGTITGLTATDWQVLGVSDEGELLIISTSDVDSLEFGGTTKEYEKSRSQWINCVATIDSLCEPYGKGTGAIKARSVRIEDINKVVGYDPETAKYGEGYVKEYGNEVTYSYNRYEAPTYTATNGLSGTASSLHGIYFYYDNGTEIVKERLETDSGGIKTGVITTVKNNYYEYNALELGTIEEDDKVAKMLFEVEDPDEVRFYWLASKYVYSSSEGIMGGLYRVLYDEVRTSDFFWESTGIAGYDNPGVRAVVHLDPSINITGNSTDGWKI